MRLPECGDEGRGGGVRGEGGGEEERRRGGAQLGGVLG